MPGFKMKKLFGICIIALIVCSGCSLFKSDQEVESVDVLLEEGNDAFNKGKFNAALDSFQQLKDWYPFSKYVIQAELKIADAHYYLKQYEDAIFAYEEFAELHPSNEAIPYVFYQIGRCYFDRIDTIDRDQTTARKALYTFRQLQKQYPDSNYAEKATDHINRCLKNLAGNEFYIARFYYKSGHYKAALDRFKAVVTNYPDVGIHQEALEYIVKCQASLEKQSHP